MLQLHKDFPMASAHRISGFSKPRFWGTYVLHPGFSWFSSFPCFPWFPHIQQSTPLLVAVWVVFVTFVIFVIPVVFVKSTELQNIGLAKPRFRNTREFAQQKKSTEKPRKKHEHCHQEATNTVFPSRWGPRNKSRNSNEQNVTSNGKSSDFLWFSRPFVHAAAKRALWASNGGGVPDWDSSVPICPFFSSWGLPERVRTATQSGPFASKQGNPHWFGIPPAEEHDYFKIQNDSFGKRLRASCALILVKRPPCDGVPKSHHFLRQGDIVGPICEGGTSAEWSWHETFSWVTKIPTRNAPNNSRNFGACISCVSEEVPTVPEGHKHRVTTPGNPRKIPQNPAETPQNPQRDPAEPSERPPQSPRRGEFPRRASRRVVPLRWWPSGTLEEVPRNFCRCFLQDSQQMKEKSHPRASVAAQRGVELLKARKCAVKASMHQSPVERLPDHERHSSCYSAGTGCRAGKTGASCRG